MSSHANSPSTANLISCESEPIHIPGAIQAHGLLLVVDTENLTVIGGAGQIETRLSEAWLDLALTELIGEEPAAIVIAQAGKTPVVSLPIGKVTGKTEVFAASLHTTSRYLLIELEPLEERGETFPATLDRLDRSGAAFERAADLDALYSVAADIFRSLTGYDRVMVYKFLEDGTGTVVGEARDPRLSAFLNHRFPASDIPAQARALYVRNRVRSIPDVDYVPQPLRPGKQLATIDLSDVAMRSVSPIHIQYLRNMKVAASASISIVRDGELWGLIACHHLSARHLGHETRLEARTLAGGLVRQIKAKEDTQRHLEAQRLRKQEDALLARLQDHKSVMAFLEESGETMRLSLGASGFAFCSRDGCRSFGIAPTAQETGELADMVAKAQDPIFSTRELSKVHNTTPSDEAIAGVLGFTLPSDGAISLLWFRTEQIEEINWAGNPHKDTAPDTGVPLSPRASFASWTELERGRSKAWSTAEIDTASRIRQMLNDVHQQYLLRQLISEKDYLIGEVNHRVQNSLQLVSAYLSMQMRSTESEETKAHLFEAQRRISAVGQVHRHLYRGNEAQTVELAQYLSELGNDLRTSMGPEWSDQINMKLEPITVPANHAVTIGLIMTELLINTQKYAYEGQPGPVDVKLITEGAEYRLIVTDHGKGTDVSRQGFGSRMIDALVLRVSGNIAYEDNAPGLRAILTAQLPAS